MIPAAGGAVFGLVYPWQETLVAPLAAHVVRTGTLMFVWPLRGCSNQPVPGATDVAITEE
ncbi:MAG: hypothetical protein HKN41_12135 [Ilumatobacter sp.]|nr:hypothetical protein [Ilumatobacter sp.]